MLLLKTVTMPSKADVPAIAKLREEMPSGPDALLILIVLISVLSLLIDLQDLHSGGDSVHELMGFISFWEFFS